MSQFFTYFVSHFNRLKLKQLVATCYDASFSQLSLFDDYEEDGQVISKEKRAYKAVITQVSHETNLEELLLNPKNILEILSGNGDFASQECVALMKEADVVVTNPPFSLFRVLLKLLMRLKKEFILLGSSQAISYSEAFQWFQVKQLHLGVTPYPKALYFEVPEGTPFDKREQGKCYKKVSIAWYTGFPIALHPRSPCWTQSFSELNLLKLDGTEIYNCDTLAEFPYDYEGKLAVPLTFLGYWNPESYHILDKTEKVTINGQEKYTRLIIQKIKMKEE